MFSALGKMMLWATGVLYTLDFQDSRVLLREGRKIGHNPLSLCENGVVANTERVYKCLRQKIFALESRTGAGAQQEELQGEYYGKKASRIPWDAQSYKIRALFFSPYPLCKSHNPNLKYRLHYFTDCCISISPGTPRSKAHLVFQ